MKSSSQHWDKIFMRTEDPALGWYEKDVSKTLELLNTIPDWQNSTIFIPGAGTSLLTKELLSRGAKLILNDISNEALESSKKRLGPKSKDVIWHCHDISREVQDDIPKVNIWIDRAVLHFLTDEDDIKGYFDNVRNKLITGGHAIFAQFSKDGASKCAGLTLHRYSIEEISDKLGSSFKLISHFNYTYINPSGDPRPYIYGLFRREDW